MLWNLIRDFFVMHVFGGWDSKGFGYYALVGWYDSGELTDYYTTDITAVNIPDQYGETLKINLGDWLSTTATAISIIIIVVLCCLFVYKIIRLIGGLIR